MRVSVVILHYETIEDTKECIDSLINTNPNYLFDIIVVDNGSRTGKIGLIQQEYISDSIHFLVSKENLGFAKGNNLGFNYAKNNLKSDIIILANNDLVFTQKQFIKKICELYEISNFDVAGPQIISLVDGKNQNPVRINFNSISDVKIRRVKFQFLLYLNYFGLDTAVRRGFAKEIVEFSPEGTEAYQLHGACLIFGKNYINHYEGLFPGTFMYAEEDFLLRRIIKDGLIMKYFDSLIVMHKEGSSTNKVMEKPQKGRRFFYKWSINSLKMLEQYMSGKLED